MDDFNRIIDSDLPDLEKLVRVYRLATSDFIEASRRQTELLQVMGDKEQIIKEQIKLGVMESAWEMFENCFLKVTGKKMYGPKS